MSEGEIVPLLDKEFIDECKALVVETEFSSRWALVEGYHKLGQAILDRANPTADPDKDRELANLTQITAGLAVELKKSERLLWYSVKFYRMYPLLDQLPEGKNTSWNTITRKYLTVKPTPCTHPADAQQEIKIVICNDCGKRIDNLKKG